MIPFVRRDQCVIPRDPNQWRDLDQRDLDPPDLERELEQHLQLAGPDMEAVRVVRRPHVSESFSRHILTWYMICTTPCIVLKALGAVVTQWGEIWARLSVFWISISSPLPSAISWAAQTASLRSGLDL